MEFVVEVYNVIQWNPDLRTLLGPTQSVLISEVSSSQGFLVKVLDNTVFCMLSILVFFPDNNLMVSDEEDVEAKAFRHQFTQL